MDDGIAADIFSAGIGTGIVVDPIAVIAGFRLLSDSIATAGPLADV